MDAEVDRAMVWQIDAETGAHKPYATGLRNPTAFAIQPRTGQLWAVVNERDEIGPDLVPDYLTSVREGVPFRDGEPSGDPIDFVAGFLSDDGKARGRPVGVTLDPRGGLIVADDLSNTVWRITPTNASVRRG
jgi:glucose/arabinose dehydrogenase